MRQTARLHENGSFDAGQSPLAGWSTFGVTDIGNVQPHVETVRSGTSSVKLFGQFDGATNYSGIEQGITVAPGDEVRAMLHEYIRSADSISGTGNQLRLNIDYYSELHGKFGSASHLGTDSVLVADGSTANNAWLETRVAQCCSGGSRGSPHGHCVCPASECRRSGPRRRHRVWPARRERHDVGRKRRWNLG